MAGLAWVKPMVLRLFGRERRRPIALGLAFFALAAGVATGGTDSTRASLVEVRLVVSRGMAGAPFDVVRDLLLPAGWSAEVWARVRGARFAVWTPDGRLLVSVPQAGEVLVLGPRADPADPPSSGVLLSGLVDPQGLGFDILDGHRVLYVVEPGQLDRYSWPGLRRSVVASGLPDADGLDRLKGLAVGPDHNVYVGVGSDSSSGPRGVILAVRPNGERKIVARGFHNVEGLAVDPAGHLWVSVNSSGGLSDGLAEIVSGRTRFERPLPAHSAPLGLAFLQSNSVPQPWRDGALVAAHGASDPASSSHPAVLWFPARGHTLGEPTTLASGFQQGENRWGRPTDVVAGPDGSIYVVDDTADAIYRLSPNRRG